MHLDPAQIAGLIVAASFAGGLNIYATVLTLGLLGRLHWVAIPAGLAPLGHTWVLVACGLLFAAEFVADKIPGLDLVWNALHTVVRVPVAGLVAWHAAQQLSPGLQIAAAVAGALIALAAHGSKTAARALVTPSPEPASNIALSTGEDVAAVGLTWFATAHPYLAGGVAAALLGLGLTVVAAGWKTLTRLRQRRQSAPGAGLP